jgi:hypothetical protein
VGQDGILRGGWQPPLPLYFETQSLDSGKSLVLVAQTIAFGRLRCL